MMPENIIDALGAFVGGRPTPPSTAKPPAAPEPAASRDPEFDERIARQLKQNRERQTPLLGGTVELVGLDDVRRALGPTWSEASARVGELAQAEIDDSLGSDDFYRAYGTSSFLICFVGADEATAEKKARRIAARIKERLMVMFPAIAQEVRPEPFVAELDSSLIGNERDGPLVDQLVRALVDLRREHEGAINRFRSPMLRRSKLLFSPAWHAAKQVIAFNHCNLDVWKAMDFRRVYHSEFPLAESQKLLSELDFITLSRSIRALYMLLKLGRAAPLLIPVRYSTIASPRTAPAYLRLLETMRPEHKSLLAIEIRDLPASEDPKSVLEKVCQISPWVRWLALAVDMSDARVEEFAGAAIWALSVELSGWKSTDPSLRPMLESLRRVAVPSGLNTIAHGANSIGLALAAAEAGMTYVDGAAIHPFTQEPRPPSPLRPVLTILPQNRALRF